MVLRHDSAEVAEVHHRVEAQVAVHHMRADAPQIAELLPVQDIEGQRVEKGAA